MIQYDDKNGDNKSPQKLSLVQKLNERNQVYQFYKDEIVWAKMKFFSAWPAKVSAFYIQILSYFTGFFFVKGESQFQSKRRKLLKKEIGDA